MRKGERKRKRVRTYEKIVFCIFEN